MDEIEAKSKIKHRIGVIREIAGNDSKSVEDLEIAVQVLKEIREYREIGTVEDIQKKMEELDRWHTDKINENIKNPFAYTSTLICHNCDHKDEYIEELETENAEYKSIGTVEELKAYKLGDCMNDCEHYDNCSNYIYSKGYNKAIDDFVTRIYNKLGCSEKDIYCIDIIEKILEQMKGGSTDE